jgi:hypothetical protein
VLTFSRRVDDTDDGGGYLALAGMPEADARPPFIQGEYLLLIHAVSQCCVLLRGGALLPDLFNRMQVGGVVHSFE